MSLRGCLLGCFSIIGVVLFFAFLIGLAAWFEGSAMARLPESDEPISIEGNCPEAEVVAWFDDDPHPLVRALKADDLDPEADESAYLQGLRDGRAEIAATPVAACLVSVREVTLTMVDAYTDAMAHVQDDDVTLNRPSVYRQLVSLIAMKRTTDEHFPRVEDAQVRLEERLGVVLGDEPGAP